MADLDKVSLLNYLQETQERAVRVLKKTKRVLIIRTANENKLDQPENTSANKDQITIRFHRRCLSANQLISLIENSAPVFSSGATLSTWMALKATERQEVRYSARHIPEWQSYLHALDNERRRILRDKTGKKANEKPVPKINSVPMAGGAPVPLSPEQEKFRKMMELLEKE